MFYLDGLSFLTIADFLKQGNAKIGTHIKSDSAQQGTVAGKNKIY